MWRSSRTYCITKRSRPRFWRRLRVSKRAVIIKDHLREGWLAQFRISVLDWVANIPYGVPCTFRYNDLRRWREMIRQHDVSTVTELMSINVYPMVINQIFGKGLHYFAVLEKS